MNCKGYAHEYIVSSMNYNNQRTSQYTNSEVQTLELVIHGEPCSKANSRRLVWRGKTPRFIKSEKALQYEKDFSAQCPSLPSPMEGEELAVTMDIYYRTQRPDLDESLILDLLEKCGVYKNDRLVREKHVYHHIDRATPRTEIRIEPRQKKAASLREVAAKTAEATTRGDNP